MAVGIGKRQFISALAGAATWPLAARAQPAKNPVRIGFLPIGSPANTYDQSLVDAFRQGLRKVGLVENRDIVLDVVWNNGDPEHAVIEVMQRGAELLVPCGSSGSVAANRLAGTIPIVFLNVGDPIAMGLVDSLSHPGRNATGFSDILADLGSKLVGLARDLSRPPATVVDYLWHIAWPDGRNRYEATEKAAQAAGVKLRSKGITDIAEVDDTIAAMKQSGATTLIVQPSPFTFQQRRRIIDSALSHGLATIFAFPVAARDGALIAYGPDYVHMYRSAPLYVDRILKGTKPADLPVELPTKIEMLVNLKTAKALGLEVPLVILIEADELIE
jgi:putative tryptophan/tyrosine transport system substrate-binding protein